MTNTQRNTTVLAVLLSILMTTGVIVIQRLNKQQQTFKDLNSKLSTEIFKFNKLIDMKPRLERDFAELRMMLANQSKVIAQTDTPAATYRYLLNILEWTKRNIAFDFSMSKTATSEAQWNEYIISGKADYRDVTNFITNLEYQRALLTLEDVTVSTDEAGASDSVLFSVIFRTHYSGDGTPLETISSKAITKYVSAFAAFNPRIHDVIDDGGDYRGLIKLESSSIVGITESRVFLRDERGIIHVLAKGSPVANGRLYYIDRSLEKAVFRINQYGIEEEITLFMGK
jgi:hypothetical protein